METLTSLPDFELAGAALSHGGKPKKPKEPKPMKEFHAKELHDGSFHVMKHSGRMGEKPIEGSAKDIHGLHDHLHEHFSKPGEAGIEKEAKEDSGEGEHAGGEGGTVQSKPDGGQGETSSHKEA